jgi:hypothetical protein
MRYCEAAVAKLAAVLLPLKQLSLNPPQGTVLATPWKGSQGQRQRPLQYLIAVGAGLGVFLLTFFPMY